MLLILAGVALATLTGNTSIIDNANKTAEKYNASANEDQKVLNQVKDLFAKYMGGEQVGETGDDDTPQTQNYTITYNANGGTGTMEQATASTIAINGFTAPGNARVFKEWNTEANGTGTSYAPGDSVSLSEDLTLYAIWNYTTASVLSIGNEVFIRGEEFYVLENSSNTQEEVTLLAKYNLDKNADETTGKYYQKANATYSQTACEFSSTNYWGSYTEDLNTYTTDAVAAAANPAQTKANNAIMRARDYATSTIGSGAEGRLLTYGEANTLQSSYAVMINGIANTNTYGNYLCYWLSSSADGSDVDYVWGVRGDYGDLYPNFYNYVDDSNFGVRPVITVSKSLIQ
ncbi:MAG: InlB B-repeat-containing protein [Clostridia bacterium]|nr:InlB B-repeat-containing protein [Clostridia bacterium]